MSLRVRLIGIGVLVLALGLTLSLGALTQENVLTIGTTDKITQLVFANSYDYWTWHTFQQVTQTLVTLPPGSTVVSPQLAERWEVSPDGTVYTFYLRKGVKFWDGEPFNCQAMAWSIGRNIYLNGPEGAVGLINMITGLECPPAKLEAEPGVKPTPDELEAFLAAKVDDPYKLIIKIAKPDATFLARLADPITPVMATSPKSTTPKYEFETAFAGTGPYKFVEWVPEERTVYEAFPGYWGEAPKTPKVVEVFYASAPALRAAVEAGEVDIGYRSFYAEDILDLQNNPNLQVLPGPSLSVRYIVFTVNMPPFDNVHVRRAIAYAVDREELNFKVFAGLNAPLYSMVPPGLWSHIDAFPTRDLEKAVDELKQAGYSPLNPLELNLWYTPTHYGDTEADVAAILKANLEATGIIKVNVNVLEWGTYVQRMSEGSLGFFLLGWYPDFIDPDNYLAPWLTESPEGLGTYLNQATSGYDKACYDQFVDLLEGAKATTDIAARTAKYEAAQRLLADCAVMIPLWQNNTQAYAIAQKNVKGIVLDASMNFRDWLIYKE
ncbi:MAG: ABC transporter substrate-binding protein [Candidatus Bipolaricaulia bacterium]